MSFDGRVLSGISVLAAVVETGNFARAGEALGLTPPASAGRWRGWRRGSACACSTAPRGR